MKQIFFLLAAFCIFTAHAYSDEIKWVTDLNKGLSEAKSSGKVAMIDVFTDWCYWCKELDAKTYKDSRVITLSKSFVSIKVNPEKDKAVMDFVKNYNIDGYPAILFVEYTGALVVKVAGFLAADPFIKKMEEVPRIQSKIASYKGEYNSGNSQHVAELMGILLDSARYDEALPIFDKIKDDKKVSKAQMGDVYVRIGLFFAMKNDYNTAQKYFIDAETLYPDTLNGFAGSYYRAYTDYLLGKKDSAISIIKKVLKNPKLPPEWKSQYETVLKTFQG